MTGIRNSEHLQEPIHMHLSKNQKTSSELFAPFL